MKQIIKMHIKLCPSAQYFVHHVKKQAILSAWKKCRTMMYAEFFVYPIETLFISMEFFDGTFHEHLK